MFEQYANKGLKREVTTVINAHRGMAERLQGVLMSIGDQIQNHNNCDQLGRLVLGLSDYDEVPEGTVMLSSTAKQVGRYVQHHLPVRWDKESKGFKIKQPKEGEAFDFDAACKAMEAVRWDKWGKESADNAFNSEKEFKKLINIAKKIHKEAEEGDEFRKKADVVLRAFNVDMTQTASAAKSVAH